MNQLDKFVGIRLYPPFIYRHHPEEGDEVKSGSITPQEKLFLSEAEAIEMFGSPLPHLRTGDDVKLLVTESENHPDVKKINSRGSKNGEFVVKEQKLAYDENSKIELTATDFVANIIGGRYFSTLESEGKIYRPFIFLKRWAYVSDQNKEKDKTVYIISEFSPSFESKDHFENWAPRIRTRFAPLPMIVGLGDTEWQNIIASQRYTYPLSAGYNFPSEEMHRIQIPSHVVVDSYWIGVPRRHNLQTARMDLTAGHLPWISQKGDNKLDDFLKELELLKPLFLSEGFAREYIEICNMCRRSEEEARRMLEEVVLKNLKAYPENMDFQCATGNNELPQVILNKTGWTLGMPKSTELKGTTSFNFTDGTKFFLDLNGGFLVFVESSDKKIKVQNLFTSEPPAILSPGEKITIGKRENYGKGAVIAASHVLISNVDGNTLEIKDLQSSENKLETKILK